MKHTNLWVMVALVALLSAASAYTYVSPDGGTVITSAASASLSKQNDIWLKYNKTGFYAKLDENTDECIKYCHAIFTVTNTFPDDISLKQLAVNQEVAYSIEDFHDMEVPADYSRYEPALIPCMNFTANCTIQQWVSDVRMEKQSVSYFRPWKDEVLPMGKSVRIRIDYVRDLSDNKQRYVDWIPVTSIMNPAAGIDRVDVYNRKWAWWNYTFINVVNITISNNVHPNSHSVIAVWVQNYTGCEQQRFTLSNDTPVQGQYLYFQNSSKCYWFLKDNIGILSQPGVTSIIKMYYNASVSLVSSIDSVGFGDDFNDNLLNATKWTNATGGSYPCRSAEEGGTLHLTGRCQDMNGYTNRAVKFNTPTYNISDAVYVTRMWVNSSIASSSSSWLIAANNTQTCDAWSTTYQCAAVYGVSDYVSYAVFEAPASTTTWTADVIGGTSYQIVAMRGNSTGQLLGFEGAGLTYKGQTAGGNPIYPYDVMKLACGNNNNCDIRFDWVVAMDAYNPNEYVLNVSASTKSNICTTSADCLVNQYCNATGFCVDNDNVYNYWPLNNTVYGYNSLNLQCNFTTWNPSNVSDVFTEVYAAPTVNQSTALVTSGVKSFLWNFSANGLWKWNCGFDWKNGTRQYSTTGNFTLNISSASASASFGGGNCQSTTGYWMAGSATTENYVLLNMSGMTAYLVDANASNVWVEGGASYNYGFNSILIDVSTVKSFIVYVGSMGRTVSRASSSASIDGRFSVTIANFTQASPAYLVNLYSENTSMPWLLNESNVMTLDIYCNTYAPERLNLKAINKTSLFIATKEIPFIFHLINNATVNRKIMPSSGLESISFFIIPSSGSMCTDTFQLSDYVMDFQGSSGYLSLITDVNSTLQTIWKERWNGVEITDVQLTLNKYYKIQVTSGAKMRDINWFLNSCNTTTQTITINEPYISAPVDYGEHSTAGFTGDFGSASVGFAYNVSSGSVVNSSFTVQYQNDSGTYTIYSSSTSGYSSGAYSTSVTVNASYILSASIYSSEYGAKTFRQLYSLYNNSGRFIEMPMLPDKIGGVDVQNIFDVLSLNILIFGVLMFGAFFNGFAALFVAFGAGLLSFLGFLNIPLALALFYMVMASLNYFSAGRGKTQ